MRFIALIFLSLITIGVAHGKEELLSKQYTANDGLASNEVYYAITDLNGYLWLGTDRGVSCFDGKTFQTFTTAQGLGSNFVDRIFINPYNNQVWVRCLDMTLYYFANGKFHAFDKNHLIKSVLPLDDFVHHLEFSPKGLRAIYTVTIGKLDIEGSFRAIQHKNTNAHIEYHIDSNTGYPYGNRDISVSEKKGFSVCGRFIPFHTNLQRITEKRLQFVKRKNGATILAILHTLVEITHGKISKLHSYPNLILGIYEDKSERLWVSQDIHAGVEKYAPNEFPDGSNGELFFPEYKVTSIHEDEEGGFWFATHDDGLFYVPDMAVQVKTVPMETSLKEKALKIESFPDGRLIVGTNRCNFYIEQNKGWLPLSALIYHKSGNHFRAQEHNSSACNLLHYDTLDKKLYHAFPLLGIYNTNTHRPEHLEYTHAYGISKVSNNRLASVGLYKMTLYNLKTNEILTTYNANKRQYAVAEMDGKLYVGNDQGLYYTSDSLGGRRLVFKSVENFNRKSRITDIEVLASKHLVAGTLGSGIFVLKDGKESFIDLYDTAMLSQAGYNMVNDIEVYGNIVFAATQNGVVWFTVSDNSPDLHYISNRNGVQATDVKSITFNNGHLCFLNQNKILSIDFNRYNKTFGHIPVFFKSTIVNDSAIHWHQGKNMLNATQRRIKFQFDALSFKMGHNVFYQYRLLNSNEKSDTSWHVTQNHEVEYIALEPGSYTFQIRALNQDYKPSKYLSQLAFTIAVPFYKQSLFIAMLMLLLIGLLIGLNFVRVKRLTKQNALREQLLKYEQQALAAQINPHFIFNSLNSIQSFILKKDERQTLKYLSQFSRLMRLSLDNSRAKWVVPQAEIDLLNVYLSLEKLRFSDKFDYKIHIHHLLNTDKYLIAPMLAQPFIENAIKHGIQNLKNRPGYIEVTATLVNESQDVLVRIEDNGPGREYTKQIKDDWRKNHLSAGVDITVNRIKLLCYEAGRKFYFNVIDKPNAQGTIVEFYMPYKYNNEQP